MTDERRQRMLDQLVTEMTRRHRRRRVVRRTGVVAVLGLAAGVTWLSSAPPVTGPTADPSPVVSRYPGSPRTGLIRTINDHELVDRLAEIHRPTGLIRAAGRVTLTDDVVDPAARPESL